MTNIEHIKLFYIGGIIKQEKFMNKKFNKWLLSACFFAAMPLMTTQVSASDLAGKDNIVCAAMDVVACVEGSACIQGAAKNFDLPEFVILDTKKKIMRADYESGHKGTSPVKTIERSGEHMILQGIENGRGWNIAINTKSGDMSGALAGEGLSFLIFGNCTVL